MEASPPPLRRNLTGEQMLDMIGVEDRVAPEEPDILAGLPRPIFSRRQREEVVMDEKWCTKCKQMRPIEEFCNKKQSPDGKSWWCRLCRTVSNTKWQSNNRDKANLCDRRYRHNHPERIKAKNQDYESNNQEKCRAKESVKHALKSGRLVRPDVCSRCFTPCKPHAHHADYSKRFDVEWLCPLCHSKADKERQEKEAANV